MYAIRTPHRDAVIFATIGIIDTMKIEKILIRKALNADAQSIFDIRIAAINSQCKVYYANQDLEIWTAGILSAHFVKMVEELGYVATVGGEVVGTGMIDLESGQIDAIFVHPSLMGRGIGRKMMDYLENLAIETGLVRLRLDSTLNAAPFYRAVGFVGNAVAEYKSPSGLSLDCIPMEKAISPANKSNRLQ